MSNAIVDWLIAQWTARFDEIMLTMGDVQPQTSVSPADDSSLNDDLLWWEQPFTCAPESPIWAGAPEQTWTEIGKTILSAAGVDPAPAAEIQSTYLEIVRQSMSSLAQDVAQRISSQVSAAKGAEAQPRKIAHRTFQADVVLPTTRVAMYLVVPDEFCQSIAAAENANAQPAAIVPHHSEEPPATEMPASRTFELLLDVELPIAVSFGRAALKLSDAIKLITGSLIELDRGLNDPVELLVNNCVIARGEVVVVEGNYGVRITEIVSQKERLQQTRRYMLN